MTKLNNNKNNEIISYQKKLKKQLLSSYALQINSKYPEIVPEYFTLYRPESKKQLLSRNDEKVLSKSVINNFIKTILEIEKSMKIKLETNIKIKMSDDGKDEINFQRSTHCIYCEKEFIDIIKLQNGLAHRKCVLDHIPRKSEIELQLNECINIINN